jgi:tetratricopeptide (TPR) repeat protein
LITRGAGARRVLWAGIAVFALLGCRQKKPTVAGPLAPPAGQAETIGWVRLELEPALSRSMMAVKPSDLPAYVKSLYRLKPDRRVLYAIEEIERLVSNRKRQATLRLRFDGRAWQVSLDKVEVGSLPEIPGAPDCQRLLADWARRQLSRVAATPASAESIDVSALEQEFEAGSTEAGIAALKEVDRLWVSRPFNPELARTAAHELVWLSAVTWDQLDLSDPLLGKALALVTVAGLLDPTHGSEDEALLWYLLGYGAAAESASERLPPDDPVHRFVRRESAGSAPADFARGSARSQYLSLWDLVRRGRKAAWYSTLDSSSFSREVGLPVLTLLARLDDFESVRQASQAIVFASFLAVSNSVAARPSSSEASEGGFGPRLEAFFGRVRGKLSAPPESQTRRFEESLDKFALANDGPILDREVLRAVYRAPFYAGIHETARFLFDQLSDTNGAERYAMLLKDPAPGTAAELQKWMLDRVEIRRGSGSAEQVARDMTTFTHLGMFPVGRIAYSVAITVTSASDASDRLATQALFSRLDTRPYGLSEAGRVSRNPLWNLPSADRFLLAVSAAGPHNSLVPEFAYRSRDMSWLRRLASDPAQPVGNRLSSLGYLQKLHENDLAFLRDQYRDLRGQEPENLSIFDAYVTMLEEAGDRTRAIETIDTWLNVHGQRQDLDWAHVLARRAQQLELAGKFEEAWRTIEPAIDTWKGEVFNRAVSIREHQGKLDEALRLAQTERKRYPEGAWAQADEARILWRLGKYTKAAELLRVAPEIGRFEWSSTIAPAFAVAFEKATPERTEKAFAALREKGLKPFSLAEMVKGASPHLEPELVSRLYSSLSLSGGEASAVALWGFDALEKAKGREASLAWLRQHTRPDHQLALVMYQERRYEMLWDLIPEQSPAAKDDVVQVLRAAALRSRRRPDDARRRVLISYFENRPRTDLVVYGLYLLGRCDRETVFAQIKDMAHVGNTGWVLGLDAAADGRYEEASDWLQVSLETGQPTNPPVAWAVEVLMRWYNSEETLPLVARDGIL